MSETLVCRQSAAAQLATEELESATRNYFPFASAHEGIAIIREEYLELEEEVFKKPSARSTERMRKEATQLAAMALRFVVDLC